MAKGIDFPPGPKKDAEDDSSGKKRGGGKQYPTKKQKKGARSTSSEVPEKLLKVLQEIRDEPALPAAEIPPETPAPKAVELFDPAAIVQSIDEAYFDLSDAGSFEEAEKICRKIKKEIKDAENLTASVGIGHNKLIAKIASGFKKPDGLTAVPRNQAEKFLSKMPVRALPGVGPKTEIVLKEKGVSRVEDLKKFSKDDLRAMLGKWGLELYFELRNAIRYN